MWATFAIFKTQLKAMGENSPNLVTLHTYMQKTRDYVISFCALLQVSVVVTEIGVVYIN
jgi:hypothetical protein